LQGIKKVTFNNTTRVFTVTTRVRNIESLLERELQVVSKQAGREFKLDT
jgi:hypothetical protein